MSDQSSALQRIEVSQTLDAVQRKLAIDELLNKVALVMETMDRVMKDGTHYGKVPGCGDKKILFKAGAEKLGLTFKLKPSFDVEERDLGAYHREYRVTCTLTDGTQGVGTCSTLEAKYRYRKVYEGKDSKRVEHDNPADNWNTCLKMGKKRAHVDAIITATASSDILTQDLEEIVEAADATGEYGKSPAGKSSQQFAGQTTKHNPPPPPKAPVSAPGDDPKAQGLALGQAEKCKARFLQVVAEKKWSFYAWLYGVGQGWILDTERLEDGRPGKFPTTAEQFDEAENGIKALMDRAAQNKGPSQAEQEAYDRAHLVEEFVGEPSDNDGGPQADHEEWMDIKVPTWSKHSKEDGCETFGDLDKKQLWWWCVKWQPTGYKGKPPKKEDVELRRVLDNVRSQENFTE